MTNYKRDVLIFGLLLIACALGAHGQSFGPYSLTGSQCASVSVDSKATVALQITGATWSGTIQPKVSIAGQTAVNLNATPVASTTVQASITANGAYVSSVSGYTTFTLCGASITNTATVYINLSTASH